VVSLMTSAHLYGGVTWRGRRFSAAMPSTVYGQDLQGGFAGLGDLQLSVLQPVLAPSGMRPGLGFSVSSWLPTGSESRWSGGPGASFGAVAALGQELGDFGWAANAGVRLGRSEEARNLLSGPGPIGGLEVHTLLNPRLALAAEGIVQGTTGLSSLPIEVGLSARYRHEGGGFAVLGVGHGIGDGVGASGGRLTLSVGYSGGRDIPPPPPQTIVVPVMVSQYRSVVTVEAPIAELVDDRIVIYQQVFFKEGRADLLEESSEVLAAVLQIVEDNPDITHLLIEGHTNARGSSAYNQRLSEARARTVASWMVDSGLPAGMMIPRGFGEDRPLVEDDHPDAMAINRRVEFIVLRGGERGGRVPDAEDLPAAVRDSQ
jgi:outer membrane protein OmpA-like peptidoglycan-associated protein